MEAHIFSAAFEHLFNVFKNCRTNSGMIIDKFRPVIGEYLLE
jgi:hypothetical protein